MGSILYCKKWEETYAWLSPVNTDTFMAYCKICLKSSRIDNSRLSQVRSHEKCHNTWSDSLSNQRAFEIGQKGQISLSKSWFVLTPEDQVAKAEIFQALHMVNKSLSFASLKEDSERFCAMLSDSIPILLWKGIKSLYLNTINISGEKEPTFNLDNFFNNLHFFFKLSSARQEDYASFENVSNVVAQYAKKHVETMFINEICGISFVRTMAKFKRIFFELLTQI